MSPISKSLLSQVTEAQGLSAAELEALDLALSGQPADKIATRIGISAVAVRKRLGAVYKKFGIAGTTHGKLAALREILEARSGLPSKPLTPEIRSDRPQRQDWGEAIDVSQFYGRTSELTALQQWIETERCRLVAILGLGGIGKSSLSIKLAQRLVQAETPSGADPAEFAVVIWRSLRHAPLLDELLADLLAVLIPDAQMPPEAANLPTLIKYLRQHRCLIVLDNLESILGSRAGYYRPGYEPYGELLQQLGEVPHQSCVVLTSREQPKEIAVLEGHTQKVRSLPLTGLTRTEAQQILQEKGTFSGTDRDWDQLMTVYGGNPLALKIVATTIQELFGSSISEFLRHATSILVGDIRDLLQQQFNRLSGLEKDLLYWLSINCKPTAFLQLQADLLPGTAQMDLLDALEALKRRSLIDNDPKIGRFTLQPVVMEYVAHQLITHICRELTAPSGTGNPIRLFKSHALLQAQAPGKIQNSQQRLLLAPIADHLINHFGNPQRIKDHLLEILARLRRDSPLTSGYAGGNAINLLCYLGIDLSGCDFSALNIWQANLKGVQLHQVNFSQADLSKSVFTGILDSILTVAFSPLEGKVLATGDADGKIGLWQTAQAEQRVTWQAHANWVRAVAFSPDGSRLASCSDDHTVKLWDVHTQKLLKTLAGHTSWVRSVAFSPDGCLIASASSDETVRLWDVATEQCVAVLKGHAGAVRAVVFSPEGDRLATGSNDHTIKLWDVAQQRVLVTLTGHTSSVQSLAFSPDGSLLASGGDDQTVRLWQIPSGELLATLEGHLALVQPVAFSPDGKLLASGGDGKIIRLWDVHTRQCIASLSGHQSGIQAVAFSPTGQTLATGSDDKTVRLWDLQTKQCIQVLQGYTHWIHTLALSPDRKTLASGSDDSTIRVWDLATGTCIQTLEGHTSRVWSVAFSPDGQTLASGSDDRTTKLWAIASGLCLQTLTEPDWVRSVAFSPDGKILLTGNVDGKVRLWEVPRGRCAATLSAHTSWVRSVVWNPDGHRFASCGDDGTIRLWQRRTRDCIGTFAGHQQRVWSVAFSPDGQTLASGSDDATVKLWEVQSGKCLHTWENQHWVRSVAFSPNGQTLATAGMDYRLNLWDLATGECRRTLPGHQNWVRSLVFQTDHRLVSGSQDGAIKCWDVETGDCQQTLMPPRPYEGMQIQQVTGLTPAQTQTLQELGAIAG